MASSTSPLSSSPARLRKVRFVQSAASAADFPEPAGAEFCLLGRSNVGKSSFINHVLDNRTLARVARSPGKTTLANFYDLGDGSFWVDLPGYGYARASHSEKDRWSRLIADYVTLRENRLGAIWLLDIRHPGTTADSQAFQYLMNLGVPLFPVYTKSDKIRRSQLQTQLAAFRRAFPCGSKGVVYSILQQEGRPKFWEAFQAWAATLEKAGS